MAPPRRVCVVGIAPKEPRLAARTFDDGIKVVRADKDIIRKLPRRLDVQLAAQCTEDSTSLQPLDERRQVFVNAAHAEVRRVVFFGQRRGQRNPVLRPMAVALRAVENITPESIRVRCQPGENRRLARRAHALPAESPREDDTLRRQLIEMRRLQPREPRPRLAGKPLARVVAEVFDVDKQDVALCRVREGSGEAEQQGEQANHDCCVWKKRAWTDEMNDFTTFLLLPKTA